MKNLRDVIYGWPLSKQAPSRSCILRRPWMRSANATCAAATAFREYEDAFLVFHGREGKEEAIRGYIHGGRKRKAHARTAHGGGTSKFIMAGKELYCRM